MKKRVFMLPTVLSVNDSVEGETIEMKVDRIVNNGEPISDGTELIYTERKDGVLPEYDIRADRRDIAVEAMAAGAIAREGRRQANIDKRADEEAKLEARKKALNELADKQKGEGEGEA